MSLNTLFAKNYLDLYVYRSYNSSTLAYIDIFKNNFLKPMQKTEKVKNHQTIFWSKKEFVYHTKFVIRK